MRKFALAAVFALASSAAVAGSALEIPINGRVARIRIKDNCHEARCASVSWSGRGSKGQGRQFKIPAMSAKTLSKMFGGKVPNLKSLMSGGYGNAGAGAPSRPAATAKQVAAASVSAPAASADEPQSASRSAALESNESPAEAKEEATRSITPATPNSAAPEERLAALAAAPKAKASPTSPVGEWLVEDGKSQIRIEECGANLCGYVSVAKKPNEKDRNNPNPSLRGRSVVGMPILLDMKPSGNRWNGRIYNAQDGRTYTGIISLKNGNTLRVQGCAFGGMICGGQNWSRVN
ncbi:MAG: DUF2147 domain-containing protein [Xanthobacteraceae bacterium]